MRIDKTITAIYCYVRNKANWKSNVSFSLRFHPIVEKMFDHF